MKTIQAALYARVSSEQQAAAHTIESQLAALTERARSDGTPVPVERQFVDEAFSGATLVRPALDRLRDLTATGVNTSTGPEGRFLNPYRQCGTDRSIGRPCWKF